MEVFDFGLRLKELRERKKLSQADVAKRLGVTRAAVSGYECNTSSPSVEQLINLALLYNASLDYITGIDKRPHFYLEGLNSYQEETILNMVDLLKQEFQRENWSKL